MSHSFFMGGAKNDQRYAKRQAEDLRVASAKLPEILKKEIKYDKVGWDFLTNWLDTQIGEIKGDGKGDDIISGMIIDWCKDRAKGVQTSSVTEITAQVCGLMDSKVLGHALMAELWAMAIDAQEQNDGIPNKLRPKAEDTKRADRIIEEVARNDVERRRDDYDFARESREFRREYDRRVDRRESRRDDIRNYEHNRPQYNRHHQQPNRRAERIVRHYTSASPSRRRRSPDRSPERSPNITPETPPRD